ncbi:hypothetical protein BgiMline_032083, partial [Biomphalaria glabrata]
LSIKFSNLITFWIGIFPCAVFFSFVHVGSLRGSLPCIYKEPKSILGLLALGYRCEIHWVRRCRYLSNVSHGNDFFMLLTLAWFGVYFFVAERPEAAVVFPILLYSKLLMDAWAYGISSAVENLAFLVVEATRSM